MARTSFILACSALIFISMPEYTLFLATPFAILAIICGKLALQNGTNQVNLAGIGKALGMAVLIGFAVEILVAFILIAFCNNWIEL
jgi:hypothetical protein